MAPKVKMTGVVRFSVLTEDYYARRYPTVEEAAAHLFSDERMELRFRYFERLCLHSMIRQSDPDFHLVVLTSDQMPRAHLWRLEDMLAPHYNIQLLTAPVGVHYKLLQEAYDLIPDQEETHFVRFRLDDDDAVDGNFVKRTKNFARSMIRMQGKRTPFIIAYNRGFYLRGRGPEAEVYDTCERAPLSAGTALVAPADDRMNPYRYNHRKFAQYFNTFTDISGPFFLRSIHGDNKSNPSEMGDTRQWSERILRRNLKRHFDLTPEQLQEI